MINNRQGGRRRGRGGNGGGGPRPQGMGGAGNRQDQRARGNAPQLLEKYKALARDAQMAGDRVQTEYYLQFADHYFRVVSESRARFEDQRPRREDVQSDDDYDDEDNNELSADEAAEPRREQPQREARPDREERFRDREPRRAERGERGERPRRDRDGERNGYAARGNGADMDDDAPEGVADGVSLDLDRLPPAIPRPVINEDEDDEGAPVQAAQRDEEPEDDRPRRTRRRRPRGEEAPVAA